MTTLKIEVDDLNPALVLRRYLRITQNSLALEIGVSEQYVRRLEQGLVSNTKGNLASFIWYKVKSDYDISELHNFILEHIRLLSIAGGSSFDEQVAFSSSKELEHLIDRWWLYWLEVKRLTVNHYPQPKTVYDFCRRLAIHPYIIQYYLRNSKNAPVPLGVTEAVNGTVEPEYWLGVLSDLKK